MRMVAAGMMIGAALLVLPDPAKASGGFSCGADDRHVHIIIDSGVTRGMGSPVLSFIGQVELKTGEVADDLRKTPFEEAHLAQYWLGDGELKLLLYREREGDTPHGYVQLVVRTRIDGETSASGTYEVHTFDATGDGEPKQTKAEGRITCFVE